MEKDEQGWAAKARAKYRLAVTEISTHGAFAGTDAEESE